jgi:23S rRNA (uracil1939-C5)-methyltransferase
MWTGGVGAVIKYVHLLNKYNIFAPLMKVRTIENVEVTDLSSKGLGVGRAGEMVVFVEGAVPGDIVDVKVVKKKRSYKQAIITDFRQRSAIRTEPFCEHFGICGGCKLQNITYEKQLEYKQKSVHDAFHKSGMTSDNVILPIIPSPQTAAYRNKLDYSFVDQRYLSDEEFQSGNAGGPGIGFHVPGRFNKVVDINKCWLQDDLTNDIRLFVNQICKENGITYFNPKEQTGLMRSLIIRNTTLGEWMVAVVFCKNDQEIIRSVMDPVRDRFPQLTSLLYVINPKRNDTIYDLNVHLHSGRDHIIEKIGGLRFRIGLKSFFQTNSRQAEVLYGVAKEYASLSGKETLYDLYTGTGTIANFMASDAGHVVGIESVQEAIEDARMNAEFNNINNTEFYAGDMLKLFEPSLYTKHGHPDVVITDPPRPGMHEKVTRRLNDCKASRIVYVSCNPATLARDIVILSENYDLQKVQPVDMFPQTSHVECVALLKLRS